MKILWWKKTKLRNMKMASIPILCVCEKLSSVYFAHKLTFTHTRITTLLITAADPGFPRWERAPSPKMGAPTYYLVKSVPKSAWKLRELDGERGARLWRPRPLGTRQWIRSSNVPFSESTRLKTIKTVALLGLGFRAQVTWPVMILNFILQLKTVFWSYVDIYNFDTHEYKEH